MVYRQNKNNPVAREDVRELNDLVASIGFKISELWASDFLALPRREPESEPEEEDVPTKQLSELKQELLALSKLDPQPRGYAFERFLQSLFGAFGLNPRRPFRITGEQIDGSFDLDNEIYLVEARWRDKQQDSAAISVFAGKVDGKATWSRGLLISYSDFTDDGIAAHAKKGATQIVGMDARDLWTVVDGQIGLVDALRVKVWRAAETGDFYVPLLRPLSA